MGLHFIKNGTKHDVCVKRPSLFPASSTTYDNSQSGLSATRVQDAIDQIDAKYPQGSVSVTADGVKTYEQILNELYVLIDRSKLTNNSTLEFYTYIYHIARIDTNLVQFSRCVVYGNYVNCGDIVLMLSGSTDKSALIDSNGTTINDLSANVVPAGRTFVLTY